jgi:hypothetical protein
MDLDRFRRLAVRLVQGEIGLDEFLADVRSAQSARLRNATLDIDRARRCGFPEVVLAEGKPIDALCEIVDHLVASNISLLVTRADPQQAQAITVGRAHAAYNPVARTVRIPKLPVGDPTRQGSVAVVTAGTADRPAAEEALETLDWMGVRATLIQDVGVAGPHRLDTHLQQLRAADAIVVVAGMEGALPSVVGGHVACPVFAVPTSAGYGANFGGFAALLAMLNSCAPNVAVVNIDAGFKAGYLAGLIARRINRAESGWTDA